MAQGKHDPGKKSRHIGRKLLIGLLSIILAFTAAVVIARFVNARRIQIRSENGLDESFCLEVGGAKQYLQIRGEDDSNPVMLVLHGGPAIPMSYYSYYWQRPLETDFTVVHWDQRGSGRTYYANDRSLPGPTVGQLRSDLAEIVSYLQDRFDDDKIILMGHSWGTALGSVYALENPEDVSVYIAVGQFVDAALNEKLPAEYAADLAREHGDTEAAGKIMDAYGVFSQPKEHADLPQLVNLRMLTAEYLPAAATLPVLEQLWMAATSPHLAPADVRWMLHTFTNMKAYAATNQDLLDELLLADRFSLHDYSTSYDMPVYFISGDKDWITPYPLVEEYAGLISAPDHDLILIPDAGHSPFLDHPGPFVEAVQNVLLP